MTNGTQGGAVEAAARFTVILTTRGAWTFEVHRDGCADIARKRRDINAGSGYPINGADVEAAIAADVAGYTEDEMGYDRNDYRVLPCATSVKA